jgi:rifampicin phosphotransferase
MTNIVWLKDIGKKDVNLVGGKGAQLGELYNHGFLVPNAFIITTKVNRIKLTDELKQEILLGYKKLGKNVSVRSSATAEDMENASFAGQYLTYLNVDSEKKLFESIKKCLESLNSKRAVAYRKKNKIKGSVYMAVVIQEMIDSKFSGVTFTANPITNNKNEILIECVKGLGEELVSGNTIPSSYLIDKKNDKIIEKKINNGIILLKKNLNKLIKISKKIEEHYKKPQDIEWAISDKFYIIQSRPITTLNNKNEKWKKIISREYGVQYCEISLRTLSPELKNHVPFKLYDQIYVPEDDNQVCYIEESVWNKFVSKLLDKWTVNNIKEYENEFFKYGEEYVDFCKDIFKLDLKTKSNFELYKIYIKYQKISLNYSPFLWTTYILNSFFSTRSKELIDSKIKKNNQDYYDVIFYPSKKAAIFKLHEKIKNKVNSKKIFEEFKWLPCLDIHNLPWSEKQFDDFIKNSVKRDKEFKINYNDVIKKLKVSKQEKKLLDTTKRFAYIKDVRDDYRRQGIYYARRLFSEIAVRMRKDIKEVSYMLQGEISEFLKVGKIPKNVKNRLEGFVIYYDKATIKCESGKKIELLKQKFGLKTEMKYSKKIKGIVASSGVAQGKVMIIKTKKDLLKVKKGEIMVAVTTHPDYVPEMQKSLAIVTDEGGITSHAAIVSRELQIPCIVGTKNASKLLKDGDLVEVDGVSGEVNKLVN